MGIQLGNVVPVGEVTLTFAARRRAMGCTVFIWLGEVLDYY